ncbi:histidine kinase [Treponema pectinovorum]|uniref:histidine kinase n=1 Tax=Treponema pectinovorum TaxID=164 RepID=UPI0011CBC95D|nr:histidine kinase [Treponema pectinovorum]
MDFYSAEAKIAVFHFIELLAIISILCVSFVIILLLYIKKNEKNRQLEKKNKEERQKAKAIIQVQEDERKRISRDLHDTVTQDIRTALLFCYYL